MTYGFTWAVVFCQAYCSKLKLACVHLPLIAKKVREVPTLGVWMDAHRLIETVFNKFLFCFFRVFFTGGWGGGDHS